MNHPHRGILLNPAKEPAIARRIAFPTEIKRVYLPLSYGHQRRCEPVIPDFETVMRGALLASPEDPADAGLYSSVTGVVAGMTTCQHPLYGPLTCSVIDCMLSAPDEKPETLPSADDHSAKELRQICQNAGIVDELDGIQLHAKLSEWAEHDTPLCLVADATEPEPYQSSAYAVLRAYGDWVMAGLAMAAKAAGIEHTHIALQTRHRRGRHLANHFPEGVIFPIRQRRYPLPAPEPPAFRGHCATIGVQACLTLARAVSTGLPQTDVILTVAGDAIARPQNVCVPFGTPIEDVLRFCGVSQEMELLVLGDTLTGVEATDRSLPILPGMTCLLAFREASHRRAHRCIGCGYCASVCQKGLLPYEIHHRLENMQYERLEILEPERCNGCGACTAVCPAGLSLAQRVQEAAHSSGTIILNWED